MKEKSDTLPPLLFNLVQGDALHKFADVFVEQDDTIFIDDSSFSLFEFPHDLFLCSSMLHDL